MTELDTEIVQPKQEEGDVIMEGYKGFVLYKGEPMCRDHVFSTTEVNHHDGKLVPCKSGFHFCPRMKDVLDYYPVHMKNVVYYRVRGSGVVEVNEDKCVTNTLELFEDCTEEMKRVAISKSVTLSDLNGDFSEEKLINAMKIDGMCIEQLPFKYHTREICRAAIVSSPPAIQFINSEFLTTEMCLIASVGWSWSLRYIPAHLMTEEMVIQACMRNSAALRYAPGELVTENVVLTLVRDSPDAIRDYLSHPSVQDTVMYEIEKVLIKCVQINGTCLFYIPFMYRTPEICVEAMKSGGRLEWVTLRHQTREIVEAAVRYDYKYAYNSVDEKFKEDRDKILKELGVFDQYTSV